MTPWRMICVGKRSLWEICKSKWSGRRKMNSSSSPRRRAVKDNLIGLPQTNNVHHLEIYIFSATKRKYFKSFFFTSYQETFFWISKFFRLLFLRHLVDVFINFFSSSKRRQKDINKLSIINLNWELIFHFHFFSLEIPTKKKAFKSDKTHHSIAPKPLSARTSTWYADDAVGNFFSSFDKLETFIFFKFTSHEIKSSLFHL